MKITIPFGCGVVGVAAMALVLAGCGEMALSETAALSLRDSLVLHASFDEGLSADYAEGDPQLYAYATRAEKDSGGEPAELGPSVALLANEGRYGGALRRPENSDIRLFYRGTNNLGFDPESWNATVSFWLRVAPDADLPPEFCDPVRIEGPRFKDGFIFVEWSKDHQPRRFRYAILPEKHIWNPDDRPWEALPVSERPMVEIDHRPFSRDRWTHVAFTLEGVNGGKDGSGALYINGKRQGAIADGWNLRMNWEEADLKLALGVAYVGDIDDLAVFDRVLSDEEVESLVEFERGIRSIYK